MFQLEKKEIRAPATAGRQAWPGCEWAHSSPPTKREVRLEGERWELSLQREESGEKKKELTQNPWAMCFKRVNRVSYKLYLLKIPRETKERDSHGRLQDFWLRVCGCTFFLLGLSLGLDVSFPLQRAVKKREVSGKGCYERHRARVQSKERQWQRRKGRKGIWKTGPRISPESRYGNQRVSRMETRMVVKTINQNAVMAADPGTGVSDQNIQGSRSPSLSFRRGVPTEPH